MATTTMNSSGQTNRNSKMNMIYWIVAIVIVLGLVWFLAFRNVPNSPAPTVDQPAGTVNTMEPRSGEIGSATGTTETSMPSAPAKTNDSNQH